MNYYYWDYLSKLDISLTSAILAYPASIKEFRMTGKIINGKKIAEETISEIQEKISAARTEGVNPPGLAVIQVGENPVSKIYVKI